MRLVCLLVSFSVLAAQPALAVCLLADYSAPAELRRSVAVVVGRALSHSLETDPSDPEGFAATLYQVEIVKSLAGELRGTITVRSENDSGRFVIETGADYLLFLYEQQGSLHVDPCGNSGPAKARVQVIELLSKAQAGK